MRGKKIIALAAIISLQMTTALSASANAQTFVLREYEGKIALFYGGEELPAAVYETSVEEFYPADRELLQKGIVLNSREELVRLIEDLGLE